MYSQWIQSTEEHQSGQAIHIMRDYHREIAGPGPGRECGECGDIRYKEDGWKCSCDNSGKDAK